MCLVRTNYRISHEMPKNGCEASEIAKEKASKENNELFDMIRMRLFHCLLF
jgi:hypothetical protein